MLKLLVGSESNSSGNECFSVPVILEQMEQGGLKEGKLAERRSRANKWLECISEEETVVANCQLRFCVFTSILTKFHGEGPSALILIVFIICI